MVENTRGVNEASSTSQPLSPYFFSSSHDAYTQQRYWSCGNFVHWDEKPLHQKRHFAGDPRIHEHGISALALSWWLEWHSHL